MNNIVIAGYGGVYEILLIVLVVFLIYNSFLRKKALTKINNNLDNPKPVSTASKKPLEKKGEGEYVDYEIINDKL